MFDIIAKTWCRLKHRQITRPVKAEYICLECGTRWPVPWEQPGEKPAAIRKEAAGESLA